MSAKNGHIARHHRLRKKKLAKRLVTRALRASLTQTQAPPPVAETAAQ